MAHSLDITVRYAAYNTFYSSEAISLRNATDISLPTQAAKHLRATPCARWYESIYSFDLSFK